MGENPGPPADFQAIYTTLSEAMALLNPGDEHTSHPAIIETDGAFWTKIQKFLQFLNWSSMSSLFVPCLDTTQ
jgi:hypothetical protein